MTRRMIVRAVRLVAVYAAGRTAHLVGDYYLQTTRQSARKGRRAHGDHRRAECRTRSTCAHRTRTGRRACLAHVAGYTLAQMALIVLVDRVCGLRLGVRAILCGQLISAGTHYFMDRRYTAKAFHDAIGKGEFHRAGQGSLASGAALLDQTWHEFWLFLAALLAAVLAKES